MGEWRGGGCLDVLALLGDAALVAVLHPAVIEVHAVLKQEGRHEVAQRLQLRVVVLTEPLGDAVIRRLDGSLPPSFLSKCDRCAILTLPGLSKSLQILSTLDMN